MKIRWESYYIHLACQRSNNALHLTPVVGLSLVHFRACTGAGELGR